MSEPKEKQAGVWEQGLVRFGLGLANWSERWFPDPLIFALIGIVVVFVAGLLLRESPAKRAIQGGKNLWTLVPFTMQMVMIIIGGYVVASTPIVYRAIQALAEIPKTPRGAVAMVALFSMLTSLISWGLSLIFSGLFVRELAHRVKGMDYRAAGAAAYHSAVLGVFIPSCGSKWIVEAPYVLQAANLHQVHLGWVVQIYMRRKRCRIW